MKIDQNFIINGTVKLVILSACLLGFILIIFILSLKCLCSPTTITANPLSSSTDPNPRCNHPNHLFYYLFWSKNHQLKRWLNKIKNGNKSTFVNGSGAGGDSSNQVQPLIENRLGMNKPNGMLLIPNRNSIFLIY